MPMILNVARGLDDFSPEKQDVTPRYRPQVIETSRRHAGTRSD